MNPTNSKGSVSQWLSDLQGEDVNKQRAQEQLWKRYFVRLSGLARNRMPTDTRRASDEEDVALSALDSFFRRADDGEFPQLTDRTGLWPLLARITAFKAIQRVKSERTQKRGGNNVLYESEMPEECVCELPLLERIIGAEPTPEFAAQMDEQVDALLEKLEEETLVQVAQLKLEGFQNTEIAETLQVGLRTIERKLARIRTLWTAEATANE